MAFLGWFGPRGLASIVFAVLVLEEGGLPHDDLILTTTYADDRTVGPRSRAHRRAPPDLYLETNMPGVFAAGDVRHSSIKRIASAVGEGAMVVAFIHRYLAAG